MEKQTDHFSIDINKNDTLIIAVIGYEFMKYCFRDSVPKPVYNLLVRLKRKEIQLPEVHVIAPRDLEAIERDIQKLGYNKHDYEIQGINALESPITFLYEEFSRFEPISWARLRRTIVDDVRRIENLLSQHQQDGLPAADLQVIRREIGRAHV